MTVVPEAAQTPPETPAAQTPPAAPIPKSYTQADLDSITEKVKTAERKRVIEEQEQQRKDAELSETDKLRKQLADEAAARADLASKLTRRERMDKAKDAATGVPALYVQAAMDELGEADFKADEVAKKAREMFDAQMNALGYAPKTGRPPLPKQAQGGTPATTGTTDFSGMTDTQYRMTLMRLTGPDQKQFRFEAGEFVKGGGKFLPG